MVTHYNANYRLGQWSVGSSNNIVLRPASTVYLTDSGTRVTNDPGPAKVVTADSNYKPGSWLIAECDSPHPNGGPSVVAHESDIPPPPGPNALLGIGNHKDWAGPHLRHNGRSNVGFIDGHVQTLKAGQWYYRSTPWMDPNRGG